MAIRIRQTQNKFGYWERQIYGNDGAWVLWDDMKWDCDAICLISCSGPGECRIGDVILRPGEVRTLPRPGYEVDKSYMYFTPQLYQDGCEECGNTKCTKKMIKEGAVIEYILVKKKIEWIEEAIKAGIVGTLALLAGVLIGKSL